MHQRILIIGCSGSGKSTLAKKLHRVTALPVVHLDRLYWLPHWTKKDKLQFVSELTRELQKMSWIVDRNFDSTLELRMKYANLVIFLDYPRLLCVKGVLQRYVKYRGTAREDMGIGCEEKIDVEFLRYIWSYNEHSRPNIIQQLQQSTVDSIIFKNRRQLTSWLTTLGKSSFFFASRK